MVYDPLVCCWIWFASILLGILNSKVLTCYILNVYEDLMCTHTWLSNIVDVNTKSFCPSLQVIYYLIVRYTHE